MRYAFALLLLGCTSSPPPMPPPSPTPVALKPGQATFESTCGACHQASGMGLPGTFPPLAGSSWVTGKPEVPIAIVLRGLQGPLKVGEQTFSNSMPPQSLTDGEIADVLSYVRSSWGNAAGPVTADQVAGVRKKWGQGSPWSEAELRKSFP